MATTLPITAESRLDAFFETLGECFDRARQSQGGTTLCRTLAGRPVCLSLSGKALAHLALPLDHGPTDTATPGTPPHLTICAWEGPADWHPQDMPWQPGSPEDSIGLATPRFRINYHEPSSLLCAWDRQSQRAFYWVRRAAGLPFWEIASPFRILFHWWAQSWGGQVAHAAAVGIDGRGVLLVGKSGSGKSTAALACLRQGMEFVGDDYVLLTADPVPAAHSLYASAKLHAASLARYFPDWAGHAGTRVGPEAKAVLYLRDLPGVCVHPQVDLCAIVMPQVTSDAHPAMVSTSPSQTWLALVPSTVFQLPDSRQTTLAFFSNFTRKLPSYTLATGGDPNRLPDALRALLTSIGREDKGAGRA